MKAIQISLVLIALAWVAYLAEQRLNEALMKRADEKREEGEPEIVNRAKSCSLTGSSRNGCPVIQIPSIETLSDYNILDGFAFMDYSRVVESNGGQSMMPTGAVDMDLYRY